MAENTTEEPQPLDALFAANQALDNGTSLSHLLATQDPNADLTRDRHLLERTMDADTKQAHRHYRQAIKSDHKNKTTMVSYQDPVWTSHLSPAARTFFTTTLFHIFDQASQAMSVADQKMGRLKEKAMADFYDSLLHHEEEYFAVFQHPPSAVLAERSTGVLGTYATLLRQRGEYLKAEQVFRTVEGSNSANTK